MYEHIHYNTYFVLIFFYLRGLYQLPYCIECVRRKNITHPQLTDVYVMTSYSCDELMLHIPYVMMKRDRYMYTK